jgi:hypothetical protein
MINYRFGSPSGKSADASDFEALFGVLVAFLPTVLMNVLKGLEKSLS